MCDSCHTDRPGWAANLPEKSDLDYTRSLLAAGFMVAVAVWVVLVFVRDPRGLVRIGRRQVGA
jgi:hypothetical protein